MFVPSSGLSVPTIHTDELERNCNTVLPKQVPGEPTKNKSKPNEEHIKSLATGARYLIFRGLSSLLDLALVTSDFMEEHLFVV